MIKLTEGKNNNQNRFTQKSLDRLEFIPGIWVNGKSYWLQHNTEKVINVEALVLKVKQDHIHSKIHFFNLYVSNHSNQTKEMKILAQHHYTNVSQEHFTFISPADNRIFHLANNNVFLVNGQCDGVGIQECTIQPFWRIYIDQIWSSLRNGSLIYQPMAKGPASSIFTMKISVGPRETKKSSIWSISALNKDEVISLDQALLKNTLAFPFEK
ncbi:hypothetical protein [Neobacillus ginsengisoli]|nr:hypothetical protein [Neobacillus ginsengisoli]